MNDGDSDVAYLFLFRSSAYLAIAAIPVEARFKRLGASVSGQVKSHARHMPSFPWNQGHDIWAILVIDIPG